MKRTVRRLCCGICVMTMSLRLWNFMKLQTGISLSWSWQMVVIFFSTFHSKKLDCVR